MFDRDVESVPLWKRWTRQDVPLRLGVSSCLLGREVRADSSHQKDNFIVDQLGPYVEWVPRCPEVEIGLGVPREPTRLELKCGGKETELALTQPESGRDLTDEMRRYARAEVESLGELDGFILKKNSATCGLKRVDVHWDGVAAGDGQGLFAQALAERWPSLPLEEEGRLGDLTLRAAFVERVFAHNRWRAFLHDEGGVEELRAFHEAHRLFLVSHDEAIYGELSLLLEQAQASRSDQLFEHYGALFNAAVQRVPGIRGHLSVLQQALRFLRGNLDSKDRRLFQLALKDYRRGALPHFVPISILRLHVEKHQLKGLANQVYLEPHPKDLLARRSA